MREFFYILRKAGPHGVEGLTIICCAIFFSAIFDLASFSVLLKLASLIIDDIKIYELFGLQINIPTLMVICLSLIFIRTALGFFAQTSIVNLSQFIQPQLRRIILSESISSISDDKVGENSDLLNRQVMQFGNVVVLNILRIIYDSSVVVMITIFCIFVAPSISLVLFSIIAIFVIFFSKRISSVASKDGRSNNKLQGLLYTQILESIKFRYEIQFEKCSDYIISRILDNSKRIALNNINNLNQQLRLKYVVEFSVFLFLFLFLWSLVFADFSSSFITAILVVCLRFIPTIYSIFSGLVRVQYNLDSIHRLYKVLSLPDKLSNIPAYWDAGFNASDGTCHKTHANSSVEVSFSKLFANETTRIDELKLLIKGPGLHVICGPSGIGKSSLLKCLTGQLTPIQGNVVWRLDGEDFAPRQFSSRMAVVNQEPFLISASIKSNLNLGRNFNEKSIREVLKQVGGISRFGAQSYDELMAKDVGELGNHLSGGEKCSLVIARALLSDKQVVILDEPTSGLDRPNCERVAELLSKTLKDRLVIVVSHDPLVIDRADVLIDLGKLNENPIRL